MKLLVFAALAFFCFATSANAVSNEAKSEILEPFPELEAPEFGDDYISALEIGQQLGQVDSGALATYLPESGPYDNPGTDIVPTPTIPSSPTCTVRGQTIFEIRKMRADAKQIGMSIMYEIQTMEKRKAYIEQMTAYLNDRIRELNKVKRDLSAEQKWIQVSNQRIAELAQREKLIKLQDVMACIKSEQERLAGERTTKTVAIGNLAQQALQLETNIRSIRAKMHQITGGAAAAMAAAAGGIPGAPAAPPPPPPPAGP